MANTPISNQENLRKRTPSTSKDTPCLLSIIENRAREVGIACINMKSFEITLTQFVDNTNYIHALSVIYTWDPVEIIMCNTSEQSPLRHRISSYLSNFQITFISRKAFDEVKGEELCLNSVFKLHEQDFEKKYVCMAALAGIIYHIESIQNISIFRNSLKISFIYLKNFLVVDFSSARMLEIVMSSQGYRKDSLAGLFDCKTPAGNRMLRGSLLQPNREINVINTKLDAVEELINNSVSRLEIKSCLIGFNNTELVTSRLIQKPKNITEKYMKSQISNIINIFHNLKQAQILLNLLIGHDFKSECLRGLIEFLDDRRIDSLYENIFQVVSQSFLNAKNKKIVLSDCLFLIKDELNSLLDISRDVYNTSIEDIRRLESQYKYKLGDPTLVIVNTNTRGFHLQLDPGVLHRNYFSQLGEHLLQVSHKGKKCFASTATLINVNEKIKSAQSEIITLSFNLIDDLCIKAREKIICLYNISHTVATLDLLLGYANFSIGCEGTRPKFQVGVISLQQARNPLLLNSKFLVPSHIKFTQSSTLQTLTGSNSSGKTTYLKNIALQCILAHAGCFIPAKEGYVPSLDYILTRIGEKESIEQNSSSFTAEMRDCGYILNTASNQSLVLIDELGKSTAHEDGLSIAWAISEKLLNIGCFTLIATHYHQLSNLEHFYPGVLNIHMEKYKIAVGSVVEEYGYGLNLASKSALPKGIVSNAKKYLEIFAEKFKYLGSSQNLCIESYKNAFKIIEDLIQLKQTHASEKDLVEMILKIKSKSISKYFSRLYPAYQLEIKLSHCKYV